MAITHKWGPLDTKTKVLSSSQLNNLEFWRSVASTSISNDTDLYIYADFRLSLSASTDTRGANAGVALFILSDLGDSIYASSDFNTGFSVIWYASPFSENVHVADFYLDSGAAARIVEVTGVMIPPSNFKVMIENNITSNRPFTCCTILEMRRYYSQST